MVMFWKNTPTFSLFKNTFEAMMIILLNVTIFLWSIGDVWLNFVYLVQKCKKPREDFMTKNLINPKQRLREMVLIYESSVSPNLYNEKHYM